MNKSLPVNEEIQLPVSCNTEASSLGEPVGGRHFEIGSGFEARGFKYDQFAGAMDPFIMVDHYVMTESTFGAHPHAGLAAVSLIFEDSEGLFHNRDSLGNDFDLQPGDLYWLNAGSGIIHDEAPRPHSRIHGLQAFVNIPNKEKEAAPSSTLVRAGNVPIVQDDEKRVRVILGQFQNQKGATIPGANTTILDAKLYPKGHLKFRQEPGYQTWVYAVTGSITLSMGSSNRELREHYAIAIKESSEDLVINNVSDHDVHLVVFSGKALHEPFVQKGPLVQSDTKALEQAERRLQQGLFGTLS